MIFLHISDIAKSDYLYAQKILNFELNQYSSRPKSSSFRSLQVNFQYVETDEFIFFCQLHSFA